MTATSKLDGYWFPRLYEDQPPPEITSAWDQVFLKDRWVPGVCKVSLKLGNRLEPYQPKGRSAARLEFSGYDPGVITIQIKLFGKFMWDDFRAFIPYIRPKNTVKIPKPMAIIHPILAAHGITHVVLNDYKAPEQESDGNELYIAELTLFEYIPIIWKVNEGPAGDKKPQVLSGTTEGPRIGHAVPAFNSDKEAPSTTGVKTTGFTQQANGGLKQPKDKKSDSDKVKPRDKVFMDVNDPYKQRGYTRIIEGTTGHGDDE